MYTYPSNSGRAAKLLMARLTRTFPAPVVLGRKQRKAATRAQMLLTVQRHTRIQKEETAAKVSSSVSRKERETKTKSAALVPESAVTAATTITSTDDVRSFLLSGKKVSLAPQWGSVDVQDVRAHDRLLRAAVPSRKAPDEYDEEYDRGRMKKVRRAVDDALVDGSAPAKAFDAASKNKGMLEIQLRGRKKKAAELAAAAAAGRGRH